MICFDADRCLAWARERTGKPLSRDGEWIAAIGHEIAGELVAVVMYTQPDSDDDIAMHVVAKPGSRWMTSDFATTAFAYPFRQLRVSRVSAAAVEGNNRFKDVLKALGFTREGMKRRCVNGRDLVLFGMLREECRYEHR